MHLRFRRVWGGFLAVAAAALSSGCAVASVHGSSHPHTAPGSTPASQPPVRIYSHPVTTTDVPAWLVATVLLVVVVLAALVAVIAMDLRGTREEQPPRRMPRLLASDPAWRSAGAIVVGALAHLGAAFVAVNVAAVVVSVSGDSRAAAGAVFVPLAVGAGFVARLLRRAGSNVLRSLWGFGAAITTGYAGTAVGLIISATGASDGVAALLGALAGFAVALLAHLDEPATGTVAALAATVIVAPLAAVSLVDHPQRQASAAVLLVIAVVGAALALTDRLRPVEMTSFAAGAAGLGAAMTLVADQADVLDETFAFALLVLLAVFALWRPAPGTVALLAFAGAATLSLIAVASDVDAGPAVGPAVAGALGGLLASMEERTAVRDGGERPRLGGTYWACAALVLIAAPFLTTADAVLVDLLGFACMLGLLLAAAAGRRLIAVAIAIVELVTAVPARFAHGAAWGRYVFEIGLAVAGVLIVVIATRTRRGPVVAMSPAAGPGVPPVASVAVAGAYGDVFDAALGVLSSYGRLHHVDRDHGRLTADEWSVAVWQLPGEPVTNVAVWADDARARVMLAAVVERCGAVAGVG